MPSVPEKLLLADNEHAGTRHAWLSLTLLPSPVAAPSSNRIPHSANHHDCDTLQAWIETTILIHNPINYYCALLTDVRRQQRDNAYAGVKCHCAEFHDRHRRFRARTRRLARRPRFWPVNCTIVTTRWISIVVQFWQATVQDRKMMYLFIYFVYLLEASFTWHTPA